jgi:hypothetical protein
MFICPIASETTSSTNQHARKKCVFLFTRPVFTLVRLLVRCSSMCTQYCSGIIGTASCEVCVHAICINALRYNIIGSCAFMLNLVSSVIKGMPGSTSRVRCTLYKVQVPGTRYRNYTTGFASHTRERMHIICSPTCVSCGNTEL